MVKYEATVMLEFTDEDLEELYGSGEDAYEALFGELQNFPFPDFDIRSIKRNGRETIIAL